MPRTSLITIFKSFIQLLLDYGDIIYDRAYNTSFHQNIESIQYNAALAITGAVRGTSREKLYQELGFESLQQRRWYRKLCCLFKIINNQSPRYLFQRVPSRNTKYFSRNSENSPQVRTKQVVVIDGSGALFEHFSLVYFSISKKHTRKTHAFLHFPETYP